ncbi:MAG: class I SAM-dependent methyltransferase [Candidatus Wallbacteria bacterium]|nr:class I SAM-dependent methyltransferase [Candidatus Wallbacteria bacterium]
MAYQYGFSDAHADSVFDEKGRGLKARKVLAVLEHHFGGAPPLERMSLLDIGCSTGLMTTHYGARFRCVIGTDIDLPAVRHAVNNAAGANLGYSLQDGMRLAFRAETFEVVVCNHVYEHVPDSRLLLEEIRRVLKPGGVCYFAAGNRLAVMEPHYKLPFLSVVPKSMAHLYLRLLGRGEHYYETHLTIFGLRRLVAGFQVIDYTARLVDSPEAFCADDMVRSGTWKQRAASLCVHLAYGLFPTYIWLLEKPRRVPIGRSQRLFRVETSVSACSTSSVGRR